MRRSTMVAFVVLGAALAALAFSTTTRLGDESGAVEPSVAAGPQTAALDWRETYGNDGDRIVFEVESLEVGADGWRAQVAVTNDTSVTYELGDPRARLDWEFGLKLFTTGDLDELERRIANGTLPATRAARTYEPALSKILRPGSTWRGTISAPGALAAGSYVRVVFGTLLSVGKPPKDMNESIVWITDHAYRLRP
jgi:hypothetical protein